MAWGAVDTAFAVDVVADVIAGVVAGVVANFNALRALALAQPLHHGLAEAVRIVTLCRRSEGDQKSRDQKRHDKSESHYSRGTKISNGTGHFAHDQQETCSLFVRRRRLSCARSLTFIVGGTHSCFRFLCGSDSRERKPHGKRE